METSTSSERPRKRRAINACAACRNSKVRCDGKHPCQRCQRNDTECLFLDAVKDTNVLRIERLEAELAGLKAAVDAPLVRNEGSMDVSQASLSPHSTTAHVLLHPQSDSTSTSRIVPTRESSGFTLQSPTNALSVPHVWGQPNSPSNAVEKELITWEQATFWFQSFFSGSHYLIPIFCERSDTLQSVVCRSAFLFDSIVSVGCRAEEGFNSPIYHRLQSTLREHLTNVLINTATPTLEAVQAIAVMAGYSENGLVMIALALRFGLQLELPNAVDQLMVNATGRSRQVSENDRRLYRLARVWHGICNLELFFSLDGGKLPSIALHTSSRRIRALVGHPERTAVDVRLLSQVELNIIRSNAYISIARHYGTSPLSRSEAHLRSTVNDVSIELSLWLEEWISIISSEPAAEQRPLALLNIHIQYEWALITLHLKALSDSGIENIAIMSDFQRDMVRTAKEAAVRHLHHLLEASSSPPSPSAGPSSQTRPPTYLSTFKWTMDYVWAKCAFSVLLVLKLSLLLRDPLPTIMLLLRDAYAVLTELNKATIGNIAYFQILQTSIEKCEGALGEHMARMQMSVGGDMDGDGGGGGLAENEFQGYAPSEFVFEWDFPGLNLRHVPLGWQDLFTDLDSVI